MIHLSKYRKYWRNLLQQNDGPVFFIWVPDQSSSGGGPHFSAQRQQIKDEGALPVIPSRSTATRKAYCPKRIYRRRHKIENYFCRIKDWRRIATRYDKLARNYLATAAIVGAHVWITL